MKRLINWQNCVKQAVIGALVIMLFLVAPTWTKVAQADDLGLVTAAEEFTKSVSDARAVFDDFYNEAQTFLNGTDVQKTLSELPKDLERLAAAPDVAARNEIQTEVTAKQQALKTFSKSLSELLSKAELADKQYEKSLATAGDKFEEAVETAQDTLKTQSHGKIASLKQTFKQTSKLVSGLSDSTTKAASGKGVFTQTQYDEQLTALNTAFDQVNEAIKSLAN